VRGFFVTGERLHAAIAFGGSAVGLLDDRVYVIGGEDREAAVVIELDVLGHGGQIFRGQTPALLALLGIHGRAKKGLLSISMTAEGVYTYVEFYYSKRIFVLGEFTGLTLGMAAAA
jgi:hypothetical protein